MAFVAYKYYQKLATKGQSSKNPPTFTIKSSTSNTFPPNYPPTKQPYGPPTKFPYHNTSKPQSSSLNTSAPLVYSNTMCQICKKLGQITNICWWRYALNNSGNNNSSQAYATLNQPKSEDSNASPPWVLNLGATTHVTNHAPHIQTSVGCSSTESLIVRNGSSNLMKDKGKGPLFQNQSCPGFFMTTT